MTIAKSISAGALAALALGGWTSFRADSSKPGAPPVVTITARDYSFDPIADIPSGVVDLRLHNAGKDFHHAAIFKLAAGKTAADLVAALKNPGPPPAWAMPVPGPNAPVPGGVSNVINMLEPGSYAVLCFVDTNGGMPHFMKGMFRGFRVVPSANKSRAPKADLGITLFDYNFKFSAPVTAGTHTVSLTNISKQVHEIEVFQIAPGKSMADLHAWLLGPMTTRPPGMPVGGVMNVPPGSHAEFRITVARGHYAMVCFLPDAKDGKPHFLHGMESVFDVK